MVDLLGYLITAALSAAMIAIVSFWNDGTRRTQALLAIGLSLWFGLSAAAGAGGLLASTSAPPPIAYFVMTPLVAGLIGASFAEGRRVMLSLPQNAILALNIGRVAGAFFVIMGWQGRLGGPFPVSAGWGDVITGVAAGLILLTGAARSRAVMVAWNLFGTADLVAAIALGVTSAEGSPLQLIHAPPGSEAMQHLPWVFVPAVLVPYYIVMHGIVWAQLSRRSTAAALAS
jgi:hypothetical protein